MNKRRKSMIRLMAGVMVIAVAAGVHTGCSGRSASGAGEETDASTWESGRRGGEITIGIGQEVFSLLPLTVFNDESMVVLRVLFLSPLERDFLTGQWTGVLADSWSISEDGRTVTVTLRDDIEWSDGRPITAGDVVSAVELLYASGAFYGGWVDLYEAYGEGTVYSEIDERTFSITASEAGAGLLPLLSLPALPMHIFKPILEREGVNGFHELWLPTQDLKDLVVSGPFRPFRYEEGERIVLRRNPRFFMRDEKGTALPYLDRVTVLFDIGLEEAYGRFESAELDWVQFGSRQLLDPEEEWGGYVIEAVGEHPATHFLVFNQNPREAPDDPGIPPPKLTWFSNRDFRTAMAHLVDRRRIIEEAAQGKAAPQYSFVPRASALYWEGADAYAPKYDPGRAAELLDSMGYQDRNGDGIREDPDGNPIAFSLATHEDNLVRVKTGGIIAEAAGAVGIQIDFQTLTWNELVHKLTGSCDFESVIIGLEGSIDPLATGANVYLSSGFLHLCNPNQTRPATPWEERMDELVELAAAALRFEEKQKIYEEAQRIWLDESPWIFTAADLEYQVHRGEYGNLRPHRQMLDRLPLHRIFRKRR